MYIKSMPYLPARDFSKYFIGASPLGTCVCVWVGGGVGTWLPASSWQTIPVGDVANDNTPAFAMLYD